MIIFKELIGKKFIFILILDLQIQLTMLLLRLKISFINTNFDLMAFAKPNLIRKLFRKRKR